ncbi:hypothetical protein WDU94_002819 [Cyamophila willieti]
MKGAHAPKRVSKGLLLLYLFIYLIPCFCFPERSDAYFSGWLDSEEKVIDLPIFEDFQSFAASASNLTAPLVTVTPPAHINNDVTGFNQGHVKAGYESSPLYNAEYPISLYSPPAVPGPAQSSSSPAWSPHPMDKLAEVSCALTPPTSPHMYSPKRDMQELNEFLKPEPLTPVAVAAEEESAGPMILSLLDEMNQTEIDDFVKNQFGANLSHFDGGAAANGGDFTMSAPEEGTYSSNELIYGGQISPVDSSSGSSCDGFTMGGNGTGLVGSGGVSPVGTSDNSCHSFSEASSSFDYTSESSETSDPDYCPYSPANKVGRKAAQKFVASGRSVAGSVGEASGGRNGVGSNGNASTGAGRKEPTAKRSRAATAGAKPYARKSSVPPEDKKLRKKEQNKNAATRYRIKKKQEVEVILGEEKGLEDKNADLVKQVEDLQREISFMKKFMRDFFKTQGRLK